MHVFTATTLTEIKRTFLPHFKPKPWCPKLKNFVPKMSAFIVNSQSIRKEIVHFYTSHLMNVFSETQTVSLLKEAPKDFTPRIIIIKLALCLFFPVWSCNMENFQLTEIPPLKPLLPPLSCHNLCYTPKFFLGQKKKKMHLRHNKDYFQLVISRRFCKKNLYL